MRISLNNTRNGLWHLWVLQWIVTYNSRIYNLKKGNPRKSEIFNVFRSLQSEHRLSVFLVSRVCWKFLILLS
jgi:hypothetical protein